MTLHRRFRTHTALVIRTTTRVPNGAGGWVEQRGPVAVVVGSLQPSSVAEALVTDKERAQERGVFYTDTGVDVQRGDQLSVVFGALTQDELDDLDLDDLGDLFAEPEQHRVVGRRRWEGAGPVDHWAFDLEQVQSAP